MNTETMISAIPAFEDNPTEGIYIYLCDLCGQPLPPQKECNSGLHIGPLGGTRGKAIKSTELARNNNRKL